MFDQLAKSAPKMPGITCPLIDAALDDLSDAMGLLDHLPMDVAMTAYNILADLRDDEGKLEEIRAANAQLRAVALYWKREAKDLTAERDTLRAEVARLRGEKTDLDWTHVIR
jgi:hypothetical protein